MRAPRVLPWANTLGLRSLAFYLILLLATSTVAQTASSSLDVVVEMLEEGRLDSAEREVREILAEADAPVVRDLLGVVLSRQGRFGEAELEYQRALAMDPDLLDARQHLARLYLLQQRETDALGHLRAAARLGDLERDLAMKLALVEMSAGDAAAAERQWRSVAERFDSAQALLYLATIRRHDPREVLGLLRRGLELAPSSEELLRAHALAALEAGEPVTAILSLEPLTRMHPGVAEYAYLTGMARIQVGDTAGAVEALEEARRLEPGRVSTLAALGLALNSQKRYDEAEEVLRGALRLDPESVDAMAALAEAELGQTKTGEAEEHARRALARDPEHLTGNLVLGMLRMREGRYDEARDALRRAVAADPGSPKAHYQLSLAYARLGDREKSRQHHELYQQALDAYEKSLSELGIGEGM